LLLDSAVDSNPDKNLLFPQLFCYFATSLSTMVLTCQEIEAAIFLSPIEKPRIEVNDL
jgi:hypothetical protein